GVALLPFINEKRLLDAIKEVYPKLGEEAKERNKEGATHLCVAAANRLNESLCNLYSTPSEEWVALDPKVSDWLAGLVARDKDFVPHTTFLSPLLDKGKPDISEDKSIIALYKPYPAQWFQAGLLPGVKFDKKHLTATDVDFVRTNGKSGGKPSGPHGFRNDNIHDYSFFFRQQGNDVYYDRGRALSSSSDIASTKQRARRAITAGHMGEEVPDRRVAGERSCRPEELEGQGQERNGQ
ncbi:5'-3' exoribonuclease 2, partial [Spiromyces aspiralis]